MAASSVVSTLDSSKQMARYVSFTCLVLALTVLGTHQAPYHPYFHSYMSPYHQQYAGHPYAPAGAGHHQARFNFNTNDLNSLLIRTSTTTTSTVTTSTTTITCTKSTTACDAAGANRFPFLNGIAKRSIDGQELDDYEPSQVASVEPTAVPDEIRAPRSPGGGIYYSPYGMLDSSMSREIHPVEASQARLFFGSTTTLTISSTVVATTTRTLSPTCSLAGFFSQCPN